MKTVMILIGSLLALSGCSQEPSGQMMTEEQNAQEIRMLENHLRELESLEAEKMLADDLFLAECIETSRATHERINEKREGFRLEFSTANSENECRNRARHQKQEEAAVGRQVERLERLKELLQSSQ
jgi:hypothetical protein